MSAKPLNLVRFARNRRNGAFFSECRTYRYELWRSWDEAKPMVQFIGLNPSTADETEDDPTIRRCISFAKRDGYGGMFMTNLFAYRSTGPKVLRKLGYWEAIGSTNNVHLINCEQLSARTVCCWGVHGQIHARGLSVLLMLVRPYCFGLTTKGHPKHPLYLSKDTPIEPFAEGGGK